MRIVARLRTKVAQLRPRACKRTLRLVYSAPDIAKHNDAVATGGALRCGRRATRGSARS
jgi:hypothetical protein